MKNKNMIKILLAAVAVVACGVIYTLIAGAAGKTSEPVVYEAVAEEETSGNEDEEKASEPDVSPSENDAPSSRQICVHVCGQVVSPGVYYMSEGARIHQAVEMAGGLTAEADQSVINMASFVTDGMQVYIPDVEEAEKEGLRPGITDTEGTADGLVNINTADAAMLMTLPGIGKSKADAIIAYRNDNGTFQSIEDIQNVAGIKESSYSKLKDLIKV